ncbi:MAG: DNA polymerase III subunit epsilon [Buchnera aphidicola (Tetraneura akinire)]
MKTDKKRKLILDIETTGMNVNGKPYLNHKIIEIGIVEMINRKLTGNNFHCYLQPNRKIDDSAFRIHGISDHFLLDKPTFRDIAKKLFNYIRNSELIIHNANFDIGFINYEFKLLNSNFLKIENYCKVIDTLDLARKLFPGKKNNLDSLCARYKIFVNREKHSAILDAKILSKIYLCMTFKQHSIDFSVIKKNKNIEKNKIPFKSRSLVVLFADNLELKKHNFYLKNMKKNFGKCLWNELNFTKKE